MTNPNYFGNRPPDISEELQQLEAENPEAYKLASFLGARNELYWLLKRRGWDPKKAGIAFTLKSWKELSEFCDQENISEEEQLDNQELVKAWYGLILRDPTVAKENSDVNLDER